MLPIEAVLPDILAALRAHPNLVIIAPPGAGKTTAVAPALLTEPWCTGQILLLSPRRIAARAAAERMAAIAGEAVGETIGYATRLDRRVSAKTRIIVQTEGIFRAWIAADPELTGVCAVIFDEAHERSLDSDVGLALALDAQSGLCRHVRLIAMSATIDGTRFATLMDAPVVVSEGRSHPLTVHHCARSASGPIEADVARTISTALAENPGHVLAFLPGVAAIDRTAERLGGLAPTVQLHKLHGTLDPAAQRAALAPVADGLRKVILATAIAETSLTIDGVRIVIDAGLARRPRYDRAAGMTRLVTERASQAAVTQRAGRAARQAPGVAYRLWEAAATAGLPPFDPPEILEADLSALLLELLIWGVADVGALRWLDPPPPAAIEEARARLRALGAIDAGGRPTPHGRAIAALPMPPRLAHMLIAARAIGVTDAAVRVAVLLSERGLGGAEVDLAVRAARWQADRGQRAEQARTLGRRWAALVAALPPEQRAETVDPAMALSAAIALAFPDRIARRRSADGSRWASSGGRGFTLDPASALARADWLAVAETQGAAAGARIMAATAIDLPTIEQLFGDDIVTHRSRDYDRAADRVVARIERRLGALVISSGDDAGLGVADRSACLIDAVRHHGLALLPWDDRSIALRQRAAFAGLSALGDADLIARLDQWLPALLGDARRLGDIRGLAAALEALLGWHDVKTLALRAPAEFVSPCGTRHAIDYAAPGGPHVTVRVQALFGLAAHPLVGAPPQPLTLILTSPSGRPLQTTSDLPGFWAGSWADVAKDMRGRYPKHAWPDDPASATPSLKTKKAQSRA